jgi:hypothetical protein
LLQIAHHHGFNPTVLYCVQHRSQTDAVFQGVSAAMVKRCAAHKESMPSCFVDKVILFIRGERPVVDYKYNLLKHPNIRCTEDGGAAPYDYTAADNALDDLPGAPENYELLDMDDFLPTEAAEMKPTIQRIRRPK